MSDVSDLTAAEYFFYFRSVMFVKRCTLSEQLPSGEWKDVAVGDLEVYYDPELYGVRIYICDENSPTASNTIIGVNTVMQVFN